MSRVVLGLAHLTALELSPVGLVTEAARAGFASVGLRVVPATIGGPAYPTRAGTEAHRALKQILAVEGGGVSDIEFIQLTPDIDVQVFAGVFEAAADLGAISVTVSGDDRDPARLTAHFAELCDLARPFGLRIVLEFMRWRAIGALPQALAIVREANKSNSAILVDALHLTRSGGKAADLISISDQWLRAAQICDAGADVPTTDAAIIAEAREGRLPPGEGALPLGDLLQALPADAFLSVEMPMPALETPARITAAHDATRRLLDRTQLGAMRPGLHRAGRGPNQRRDS
jgi:sugar phosphate isomerase/epimerase